MPRRALNLLLAGLIALGLSPSLPVHAAGTTVRAHSPLVRLAPRPGAAQPATSSTPRGNLPCDLANAYHLGTIQAGVNDGAGQVVAVIDPYDDPTLAADFATFSSTLHLPTTGLVIDSPFGAADTHAPDYLVWRDEVTLDVEWIHAIAPGATIHWIQARSSADADMVAAIDYAVVHTNADIVSLSWTFPEGTGAGYLSRTTIQDYDAQHFPATNGAGKPVLYFASAGDAGFQVNWPAESPKVIGIGGTSVRSDAFGYSFSPGDHADCSAANPARAGVNSTNETVWGASTPNANCATTAAPGQFCGTGGGVAGFEALPDYQSSFGIFASGRTVPDVSVLADPSTGVATYQAGSWNAPTGGTSLGPPVWAGIAARLNQAKAANLSGVSWLYSLPVATYNDIQHGSSPSQWDSHCQTEAINCVAQVGYDLVTGRGSPLYDRLQANVAPGAPPTAQSFTYYLPWFDRISDPGFTGDNIHIVNPNPITATLKVMIPGCPAIQDSVFGFNEGVYTCTNGFGGPVVIVSNQRLLVSQRVQYFQTFNESKAISATAAAPHLEFAWYDLVSDPGFSSDNIHVVNPQTTDTTVTVSIPGCAAQSYAIHAGAERVFSCPTGFGGPVKVDGTQPVIASQRVKYYGSFNETVALPASGQAPTLYFTWFDRISDPGFANDNIHVLGPPGTTVDVSIPSGYGGQCSVPSVTLPASGETYVTCVSGFGGPVVLQARGNVNIGATQRVQFYQSFNEVPALALADAGSAMFVAWFDLLSDPGFAADIVHVLNPSSSQPASYSVSIPGCNPQQGLLVPLGETIVTCPGGFGGPVVIQTDSTSPPVLASVRVRYWDSFNEVSASS